MTPEEQFRKIDNTLQSLAETQAQHESLIAKNTAGIRDLIVVSRAFLESQKELRESQKELREAQREDSELFRKSRQAHDRDMAELRELHKDTEEKLNALIAEVDRIIRRDQE